MNNLKEYILEKFKLNSKNIRKYNLSQEDKDKVIDKLCIYFQGGGLYGNKEYETRLGIVEKNFDNDIYKFFDKLDLWDDMSDYIGIDCKELTNYIEMNKEELYQEIKDFVLDDIIQ